MSEVPSREQALALMQEYTDSVNLRKHMYAVEAAMRAYARKYDEDEDLWGVTGLIHDFDYERYPNEALSPVEEHPSSGVAILRENGWPDEILHAVIGVLPYTLLPAASHESKWYQYNSDPSHLHQSNIHRGFHSGLRTRVLAQWVLIVRVHTCGLRRAPFSHPLNH